MNNLSTPQIKNILMAILIFVLAIWLSPFLFILLFVLLGVWLYRRKEKITLIEAIKQTWYPRGIVGFFLYSNSEIWKNYFETELIPQFKDKLIVWNWSTRNQNGWNELLLEARLLRSYKTRGNFYPVAILISPDGTVDTFSFHDAYIDHIKSGKPRYKELEKQLLDRVKKIKIDLFHSHDHGDTKEMKLP